MQEKGKGIKIIMLSLIFVLFLFLEQAPCQEPEAKEIVNHDGETKEIEVKESEPYPIGFYLVPASELVRVKKAGFNLVTIHETTAGPAKYYLDLAEEQGLKVLIETTDLVRKGKDIDEMVTELRNHPASFCWYIVGEPAAYHDVETVKRYYDAVKKIDSHHPVFLEGASHAFYDLAEIFGIQSYPVPNAPLRKVRTDTRKAVLKEYVGKPVWVILQCFEEGWSTEGIPHIALPEPWQIRYMTYTAIANGAKGILYFLYQNNTVIGPDKRDDKPLPDKSPVLWEELTKIAAEVKEISHVLMTGTPCEESINIVDDDYYTFSILAKIHKGRIYIIAVNDTDNKKEGHFKIKSDLATADNEIKVPFENRNLTMEKDGIFSDIFEQYEVHVYVIDADKR